MLCYDRQMRTDGKIMCVCKHIYIYITAKAVTFVINSFLYTLLLVKLMSDMRTGWDTSATTCP